MRSHWDAEVFFPSLACMCEVLMHISGWTMDLEMLNHGAKIVRCSHRGSLMNAGPFSNDYSFFFQDEGGTAPQRNVCTALSHRPHDSANGDNQIHYSMYTWLGCD